MKLSPFTTIRAKPNGLVLKSLFHTSEVSLTAKRNELFDHGILIEEKSYRSTLDGYFDRLERQFARSQPTLGYIETTSRCPFACVMCPKSKNTLDRQNSVMPMPVFENILGQLKNQKFITLHLFGDPLMDPLLFERLELCKRSGHAAIFSTNIPLFKRKDIDRLFEVPIQEMIVSVDSLDPVNYSEIRRSPGNRADRHAQTLGPFLNFLRAFRTRPHQIAKLTLRAVRLKANHADVEAIRALVEGDDRMRFDLKPFIDFPKTDRPDLGEDTFADLQEPALIYQVLGQKLPFKCSKPWKFGELAATSDGDVVPCCLCFNGPFSLGSLKTHTLSELYFSDRYRDFRRKIFFSELDKDWLCHSCNSDSAYLHVDQNYAHQISEFMNTVERAL